MKLTRDDFEFLIECVSAREACMSQGDMISEMFEAILLRKGEENDPDDIKRKLEEKQRIKNKERKPVSERCVLLKAKLIQMRDERDAEELLSSSNNIWEKS